MKILGSVFLIFFVLQTCAQNGNNTITVKRSHGCDSELLHTIAHIGGIWHGKISKDSLLAQKGIEVVSDLNGCEILSYEFQVGDRKIQCAGSDIPIEVRRIISKLSDFVRIKFTNIKVKFPDRTVNSLRPMELQIFSSNDGSRVSDLNPEEGIVMVAYYSGVQKKGIMRDSLQSHNKIIVCPGYDSYKIIKYVWNMQLENSNWPEGIWSEGYGYEETLPTELRVALPRLKPGKCLHFLEIYAENSDGKKIRLPDVKCCTIK